MKKVLLLLVIFNTTVSYGASTFGKMFDIVYRNELYYSSYIFLKKSVERNIKLSPAKVNRILDVIHPSVFVHDYDLDKFAGKNTQINYAVGVRRFFMNDFVESKKRLRQVSVKNPMFVESNYLLGLIYLTERKQKLALRHFNRCVKYTSIKKRTVEKSEQYIRTFRNRCIQQISRIYFAAKKHKKGLKVLDYVQKDDYIWPRFLIDRAWSYYWLGENERALGSVMTYKAPLLKRFMIPEANYLRALIYYEMCYFEKSERISKEFDRNTWRFRNIAKNASKNQLLKLIEMKNEPKKASNKFLYYYLKGFKQDIRYFSYMKSNKQLEEEINKLSQIRSLKQAKIFLNSLYFYKSAIKEDFQDFLKNLSDDYYLQIRQMRNAFVKLKLTTSINRRKLLAKSNSTKFDKDTIEDISLGELSDTNDKFIWDFRGGFWADELGDYAVALKNKCEG